VRSYRTHCLFHTAAKAGVDPLHFRHCVRKHEGVT